MKPTVGRTVHFYWNEGFTGEERVPRCEPEAAIITAVWANADVSLFVMSAGYTTSLTDSVPYSRTPTTGCWTWPPRD